MSGFWRSRGTDLKSAFLRLAGFSIVVLLTVFHGFNLQRTAHQCALKLADIVAQVAVSFRLTGRYRATADPRTTSVNNRRGWRTRGGRAALQRHQAEQTDTSDAGFHFH